MERDVQDDLKDLSEETFLRSLTGNYRELVKVSEKKGHGANFGADLKDLAGYLSLTATVYRLNRRDEVLTPRVSDILRELKELSDFSAGRWRYLSGVGAATLDALLGGFPFAEVEYEPVDLDGEGQLSGLADSRPILVPADDRQQRQELKHILKESPTGAVRPRILPSFIDIICMCADAEALAGMVSGAIAHLLKMRNQDAVIRHLVRQRVAVAIDIFARLIPEKFAMLANAMEDDIDNASRIYLRFLADEAVLLSVELLPQPGMVSDASRLAAQLISPILKAGELEERQIGMALVANRSPAAASMALREIIERIERQYGKDVSPTGMGRRTTRSYAAPAAWVLINEVLDRIWPAQNGPLTKSTSACVCGIAEATYIRGELEFQTFEAPEVKSAAVSNAGIGNVGGRRERASTHDHIRSAVSYRNAKYQLNCTLEFLEQAIRDVRRQSGVNHVDSLRLEATIAVVHRWREDMAWRLLHGAYEKEQLRKSSVSFPRFPQMKVTLPIADRVNKIVSAVQPLIDAMLAGMIRPPEDKVVDICADVAE